MKLSSPVANYLDGLIDERIEAMTKGRQQQIKKMENRIAEREQYSDYADIVSDLFEIRQENVVLAARLEKLVERNRIFASVKATLDESVRSIRETNAIERQKLIEAIMAGVMNELKEPKLQSDILDRCLVDLERIASPQSTTNATAASPS